jgi:ubiquitin C-terminal hydrolase
MNESKKCSLEDCLEEYCKQEKLDDDNKWFCPKCNKKLNALKQISIWKCPKILVISLKRFQKAKAGRIKIENFVSFPFALEMKKYITKLNISEHTTYELNAVVNHVGGLSGGHYYCYAKNNYSQKFYEFNDTSVSLLENNKIVTENAYLLYYTIKTT